MDASYLNTLLLAVSGYFLGRVLKKVDEIDLSTKNISLDIALIKQDRQLIWDKIKEMEADLEELKRLVKGH